MTAQVKHIVSNIKWELNFNERKEVHALQNKLSNWSKTEMLVAMEEIFSQVCPKDETWQIQSLEINLGDLAYENLSQDLPQRFRTALLDKLNEILYKGYSDGQPLKIAENKNSRLNWLKSYLELGFMPWNQVGSISINSLLLEQMTENREALVLIIRQLGVLKPVRKRIAWQFADHSVRKIIKELEPNTHQEIFDFTAHFTVIQEKENIVQSTSSDFKKNLWFWVLNYLFEERGTLFNRLQFMESSIRQMALHYNMGFDVLFVEIENAVNLIAQKTTVKGEFIQTLKMLSGAIQTKSKSLLNVNRDKGFYKRELAHLLADKRARRTTENKGKTNELIEQLFQRDRVGLKETLVGMGAYVATWKTILPDLSKNVRRLIFQTIHPAHYKLQDELTQLVKEMGYLNSSSVRLVWEATCLSYFITHNDQPIARREFVACVFDSLQLKGKVRRKSNGRRMIARLNTAQFVERGISLSSYQALKAVLIHQVEEENTKTKNSELNRLVKSWFNRSLSPKIGAESESKWIEYQHLFEQFCVSNPKGLLEAVKSQHQNPNFEMAFQSAVDRKQMYFLLQYEESEKGKFLRSFYQFLRNSDHIRRQLTGYDYEAWVETAFFKLLSEPDLHITDYAVYLFKVLHQSLGYLTDSTKWVVFEDLLNSESLKGFNGLDQVRLAKIVKEIENHPQSLAIAETDKVITVRRTSLQSKLFEALERNPEKWVMEVSEREKKDILKAFMPAGNRIYNEFMEKTRRLGSTNPSGLKKQYELVFWKTLANFDRSHGDSRSFERLLHEVLKNYRKVHFLEKTGGDRKKKSRSEESPAAQIYLLQLNEFLSLKEDVLVKSFDLAPVFENLVVGQPHQLRQILDKAELTSEQLLALTNQVDFNLFTARMFAGSAQINMEIRTAFSLMVELGKLGGSSAFSQRLLQNLWQDAIILSNHSSKAELVLLQRVRDLFKTLALSTDISVNAVLEILKQGYGRLPSYLKTYFVNMNKGFKSILEPRNKAVAEEKKSAVKRAIESRELTPVFKMMFEEGRLADDFKSESSLFTTVENWPALLEDYPFEFYETLKSVSLTDPILFRLNAEIPFDQLIKAILETNPNQAVVLNAVQTLYALFEHNEFVGLSAVDLQNLLFKKLITAWKNNNWRMVSPQQLWNELLWEAHLKYGADPQRFLVDLSAIRQLVPTAYRFSLNALIESEMTKNKSTNQALIQLTDQLKTVALTDGEKPEVITETIAINNAGIVLINSYLGLLFERLGLMENSCFKSEDDQHKALHFLQFIVNGLTDNEEHYLVLNKVMCGLHPTTPIKGGTVITDDEKELMNGMIRAIIAYWPAIGECSVDGFRGNWLIRNGLLSETEDGWKLKIEKRPYDILINKSPFSFSIIKYQWMEKPLQVEWEY